ncbi:MAG: hypothetical protein BVN29_06725 [Nitrospira sp. ST-bin5]|nr:MAG: hypothetical protein BVN29_06725 [Nitrospira sp. ST-bin5]
MRREPVDPLILLAISAELTWRLMTTIHLVSSALITGFERRLEVGGFLLLEDSLWTMAALERNRWLIYSISDGWFRA